MDAESNRPRQEVSDWPPDSGAHGEESRPAAWPGRRDLAASLARWNRAALLGDAQVSAILAFEATDGSAGTAGTARLGLQEVVAYAGVAVTLAGVALAIGLHYEQLGSLGRLAIYAVVTATAFVAARQLSGRAGAGERASAVCVTLGILGCGAIVGDAAASIGLATRRELVVFGGPPGPTGSFEDVDYSGNAALGLAVLTALALVSLTRKVSTVVALTLIGSAFATTYVSWHAAGGSSETVAGLIGLLPGAMLIALAHQPRFRAGPACEVMRTFGTLVPIGALYAVDGALPATFAALGGILSVAALAGARRFGSTGFAVAGGLGLFGLVADVVARYFADALGAPIAFVVSGLALIAAALLIQRVIQANTVHGGSLGV